MLSLRALARSIPKTTFRSSSAFRPLSSFTKPGFLQPTWKPAFRPSCSAFSAFSTSSRRWEPAGESDAELSAKIAEELSLEKDSRDPSAMTPEVQDFIDNSSFKLKDVPGSQEVSLTKQFGDETIKVTFSIADLNNIDEDPNQIEDDDALDDEEDTINQTGTKGGNVKVTAEDSVAPADRADLEDAEGRADAPSPGFTTRLHVSITKPGQGAIEVEAIAEDGMIEIMEIYYYPKGEAAAAEGAEKEHAKANIYSGPPFGNLDEDLQGMLERYLDERGINAQLALFVPDYIDYKEQREYVQWLENVKNFVDA